MHTRAEAAVVSKASSSVGRAADSKSAGRGFESLLACQREARDEIDDDDEHEDSHDRTSSARRTTLGLDRAGCRCGVQSPFVAARCVLACSTRSSPLVWDKFAEPKPTGRDRRARCASARAVDAARSTGTTKVTRVADEVVGELAQGRPGRRARRRQVSTDRRDRHLAHRRRHRRRVRRGLVRDHRPHLQGVGPWPIDERQQPARATAHADDGAAADAGRGQANEVVRRAGLLGLREAR